MDPNPENINSSIVFIKNIIGGDNKMPVIRKGSSMKKHTLHKIVDKPLLVDLGGGNFLHIRHMTKDKLSTAKD